MGYIMKKKVIDAFRTLGIGTDSEEAKAAEAYKRLAFEHHPDRHHPDNDAVTEKFQEISAAWNIVFRYYKNSRQSRDSDSEFGLCYELCYGNDNSDNFEAELDGAEKLAFYRLLFRKAIVGSESSQDSENGFGARSQLSGAVCGKSISRDIPSIMIEQDINTAQQEENDDAYRERLYAFGEELREEERAEAKAKYKKEKEMARLASAQSQALEAIRNADTSSAKAVIAKYNLDVNAPKRVFQATRKSPQAPTRYDTFLHVAAIKCDVDFVKYLISKGAKESSVNRALLTPFHVAILHGNVPVARFLFSRVIKAQEGTHLPIAASNGRTLLQLAIASSSLPMIKMALEYTTVRDVLKCWQKISSHDILSILKTKRGFLTPRHYESRFKPFRQTERARKRAAIKRKARGRSRKHARRAGRNKNFRGKVRRRKIIKERRKAAKTWRKEARRKAEGRRRKAVQGAGGDKPRKKKPKVNREMRRADEQMKRTGQKWKKVALEREKAGQERKWAEYERKWTEQERKRVEQEMKRAEKWSKRVKLGSLRAQEQKRDQKGEREAGKIERLRAMQERRRVEEEVKRAEQERRVEERREAEQGRRKTEGRRNAVQERRIAEQERNAEQQRRRIRDERERRRAEEDVRRWVAVQERKAEQERREAEEARKKVEEDQRWRHEQRKRIEEKRKAKEEDKQVDGDKRRPEEQWNRIEEQGMMAAATCRKEVTEYNHKPDTKLEEKPPETTKFAQEALVAKSSPQKISANLLQRLNEDPEVKRAEGLRRLQAQAEEHKRLRLARENLPQTSKSAVELPQTRDATNEPGQMLHQTSKTEKILSTQLFQRLNQDPEEKRREGLRRLEAQAEEHKQRRLARENLLPATKSEVTSSASTSSLRQSPTPRSIPMQELEGKIPQISKPEQANSSTQTTTSGKISADLSKRLNEDPEAKRAEGLRRLRAQAEEHARLTLARENLLTSAPKLEVGLNGSTPKRGLSPASQSIPPPTLEEKPPLTKADTKEPGQSLPQTPRTEQISAKNLERLNEDPEAKRAEGLRRLRAQAEENERHKLARGNLAPPSEVGSKAPTTTPQVILPQVNLPGPGETSATVPNESKVFPANPKSRSEVDVTPERSAQNQSTDANYSVPASTPSSTVPSTQTRPSKQRKFYPIYIPRF